MSLPQRNHSTGNATRLSALGVTEELLRTAVLKGSSERGEIDNLHPDTTPGYVEWSWIMQSVRSQLMKQKWTKSKWRNVHRVVSPNENFAIFVMRGNAGTGLRGADPCSARPKKSDYQRIVMHNGGWRPDADQFALFGDHELLPEESVENLGVDMDHWCLLFHSSETEIRYELSFPTSLDTRNFIRGWRERIILNPIQLVHDVKVDPRNMSNEIQFDLRKKEA